MKLKLKMLSGMVICSMLVYTACKKSPSNPASPALTPSQVASAVALNISGSLFGGLGAFDVSGGLNAPTDFAIKGKVLQTTANPDCSLIVDTTVNVTTTASGTTISLGGSIKFNFGCTNNVVSSYTTDDKVTIKITSPSLDLNYAVGEDFTLTALTPTSPTSNLSLTGSLNSNGAYNILTGSPKGSGTEVFNYNLTSLIIDPNVGDVTSGSATFSTSGSGPKGSWNYSGTITFSGNQMATVTISGKTYTVNLQTGAVS